jgi:hydrogenase maturation factor
MSKQYNDPEGVEILLRLRRQKQVREEQEQAVPDRTGMQGELKLDLGNGSIVVTGWFEITPDRALSWLDFNRDNRKVNKGKVQSLARQILTGDYVITHQGMAFDSRNNLIDGQHTLKAVIMTGRTIRRMVTFGIPDKMDGKHFNTMDVLDQGGRTVGDQLRIAHGIHEPTAVRQICNSLATLCYGKRARNLSVGQVLQVYHLFKESVDYVIAARSKQKGLRSAGVLAGFAFARSAMPAPVEKLFVELNSGAGMMDAAELKKRKESGKDARPLEHLHHFLTGQVSLLFNKKLNNCLAEVTVQAIYAEQRKARIKELEYADVGVKWFAARQKERVEKVATMLRLPEK